MFDGRRDPQGVLFSISGVVGPFDNLHREILIGCDPIVEDERGIMNDLINPPRESSGMKAINEATTRTQMVKPRNVLSMPYHLSTS